MNLPAATILNRIAKTTRMKNPTMKRLFQMSQEDLNAALDAQAEVLAAAGHDPLVVSAYQALEPLLLENEAISLFISKTGDSTLRAALPEVLTKREAVSLADREMMLSETQKKELFELLH